MSKSIDTHRQVAMFDFMTSRGWDSPTAAKACFALHPLDDPGSHQVDGIVAPVPGRAFEKAVRRRSREFARSMKRASQSDALRLAVDTLGDYTRLATEQGESYYVARFAEMVAAGDQVERD